MLDEEEEDDELFLVMVPALQLCMYDEKMPEHTSSLSGAQRVKEILEGHERWCKVEFRMESHIFRAVAHFLRVENLLRDTRINPTSARIIAPGFYPGVFYGVIYISTGKAAVKDA